MKHLLLIFALCACATIVSAQDNYRRSASAGSDIYTNYNLRGLGENPGDVGAAPAGAGEWILLTAALATMGSALLLRRQ